MTTKVFLIIAVSFLAIQNSYCQFGSRNVVETGINKIIDITTVDINNDNLQDIVVTKHFNHSNVSYYLNQGNATFDVEELIDSNLQKPLAIASGDFNSDGWIDLVSVDYVLNQVTWYTNNAGVFISQIIDTSLFLATEVKVADIDLDNDLDIVVIGDIELAIYYNNGAGIFTKQSIPQGGDPTEYYALEVDDIDGDGFKDILVGGTTIRVYKNVGGVVSFDSVRTNLIPENFNLSFFIGLTDCDNDGDIDLVSDGNGNSIRWFTNDGNGNFTNPQLIASDVPNGNLLSVNLNDFDNNGGVDLFTISSSFELVWYTNDGSGNFSAPHFIFQGNSWASKVYSSDLNNDNLADIIWSSDLSFHLNNTPLQVNYQENYDFSFYPNPTNSNLFIKTKAQGKLSIFNSLGQLIYQDIKLNKGNNAIELSLKPQVYVLAFNSNNHITKRKLIIK